ncbi:MAG TPA: DMT family transporter [Nitratidesulfovibrio sp.]|nr:DMT family transporter [Nitratidesulfovibrio sp.]
MPPASPPRVTVRLPQPVAGASRGPDWRAYLDLTAAMVIVGSSVAAARFVSLTLPPHLVQELRFLVAACIAVPLLYRREGGLPRLPVRDWGVLFLQAAAGSLLFNVLLLAGVARLDAAAAGVVTSTTPAVMALASLVLLRERPGARTLAGIACCVAGVLVLRLAPVSGTAGGDASGLVATGVDGIGLLLVLGAVCCETLFLLLGRTLRTPVSPLAASTACTLFGAVQFLPLALPQAHRVAELDVTGWLLVGYYGAVITVAAYIFWFRGVARVNAGTAGAFTAVLPVSALGFSALLLGEPVGWAHLAGVACVLCGIWCVTRR